MKRHFPVALKRVVVKIGSSVLSDKKGALQQERLKGLVDQISLLVDRGIKVVIISSGAIATGIDALGMKSRPTTLAGLQATAAVGQGLLIERYNDCFKKNGKCCAQVLLTWDDFNERSRYNNARNTLLTLLSYNVVPVINENDTVSTEEIKFGDNDHLSALVANLIEAQLLIVLSDVDGFYKGKGAERHVIPLIEKIDDELCALACDTDKRMISTGGMITKLEAAKIVVDSGIPCLIANGATASILLKVIDGEPVGTLFLPKTVQLESKKRWIAYSTKARGRIIVDDGAKDALVQKGRSLLCPGIIEVQGDFIAGDIISVVSANGDEFAKGVCNYSAEELCRSKGCKLSSEVIHRNSLALVKK